MIESPRDIGSLAALLARRAAAEPERRGFLFLADGRDDERATTYGERLDWRARALAACLAERIVPGDRVLLCYPAGLEFLTAFFACAYAGAVAVPVAAPRGGGRHEHALTALASVIADCAPRLLLADAETRRTLDGARFDRPKDAPEVVASDRLHLDRTIDSIPALAPENLCYLQYTSGSTAQPRGVMVSQRSLFANLAAVQQTIRQTRDGICVTWLPHYHDMGLGGLLGALYGGYLCVFMSPLAFMARPLRWLKAITRYRGTWSGAPNFAFDLCTRHVRPADLAQLDLTSWRVVANGSEPVRKETIECFVETFAPAGFRPEAMMPSYGLAEAVVFVSGIAKRRPPLFLGLDAEALRRGEIRDASESSAAAWQVACGRPAHGHGFRIVDPESRRLIPPGRIGEIWITGPSVAEGYWQRPEDSKTTFRARLAGPDADDRTYLRSGDVGFERDGQICITGRLKDLIIVAGANHYPQDIEATVEAAHPALRAGGAVAFALPGPVERLVILAEVAPNGVETEAVLAAVRTAIAGDHGLSVDTVALLPPRSLAKTSSGKLRRAAMRTRWQAGEIDCLARWDAAGSDDRSENRTAEYAPLDEFASDPQARALERRIVACARRLLGDPALELDPDRPIGGLGLGSLELTQLKLAVEAELGIVLPLEPLLRGDSLRALVAALRAGEGPPVAGLEDAAHPFESRINPVLGDLLRRLGLDRRFVRGQGSWLWDAEGRRCLDAIAGYGSVPFGHNPPEIWDAVETLRKNGEPAIVQPSLLDAAGALAERLIAIAPEGLKHVTFANSGAEAAEIGLKLARAATGRTRVLATANGFHGKTLGALSVTGRLDYQAGFAVPADAVEFVNFGELDELESRLERRGAEFAAFIVEPIQGEGGIVEPPPGYLKQAAALCRRHGVKLILDEIQTGLGRTGRLFACEDEGVSPDILLLAKALGGGLLPLGAVLYRSECYSEAFALKHSSTFAGNALACRVGIAVLDRLRAGEGALLRDLRERAERMIAGLREVVRRHPRVLKRVRGRGFLLGLELSAARDDYLGDGLLGILAEQGYVSALVASHLLAVQGIRVAPTLFSNRVLRIEPPLTLEPENCARLVDGVERTVALLDAGDLAGLTAHLVEPGAERASAKPVAMARASRRRAARRASDGTFAFVAHPIDAASYPSFDPSLAELSPAAVAELGARLSGLLEPFVAATTRIRGAEGRSAYGEFIVVPSDSETLLRGPRAANVERVRRAVTLARDRGARIVGLGGYVSILSGGGSELGDLGVALTTGSAYTALSALELVEQAGARIGLAPEAASVGILGAGGAVGQALSRLFVRRAGRLLLLGNPHHPATSRRRLLALVETLVETLVRASDASEQSPIAAAAARAAARNGGDPASIAAALQEEGRIVPVDSLDALLAESDVVVTATSEPGPLAGALRFGRGVLVCELSRPRNLPASLAEERPDLVLLDGGVVRLPRGSEAGWRFGLPPGHAYACMCEPMLLALEERYDAAAPVGVPPPGLIEDLRRWAHRHGFAPATDLSFGRTLRARAWSDARAARRRAGKAVPHAAELFPTPE